MRLLFIDDRPGDVDLLVRDLQRFGFELEHVRVDSELELLVALDDRSWSAVICEHAPAGLGPLGALRLVRAQDRDIPILLVTGNADDDAAGEALGAGANDVFVKSRLHRFGHALERELRDVQLRQERRSLFEGLRRAENRYRRVFERLPVGIGISTPDGRLIGVNERFAAIHGIAIDELVGTRVEDLGWDPRRTEEWSEHRYVRGDGVMVHTRATAAPVLDDDGAVAQLTWLVEDITAQRRHEEELRSHKEQLDDAQRMARFGSFVHDLTTGERAWSDELYRIWGLEPGDELVSDALQSRIHPEDFERFAARRQAILAMRTPYAGDYRIILPGGEVRTVHERGRVLLDERNQPTRVLGVVHDVTEARVQEAELQRRAVQQALVANLGQAALSGETIEILFGSAVENVARLINVGHCEIWQTNGDRFRLFSSLGWKDTGGLEIDRSSETQADETVRTGTPVIVEDMAHEPRFTPSPFLLRAGIVSGVTVPISAGNIGAWGVLGAHATAPRQFSPADVDFLRSVATILGQAVERDRVDQQLVLHAAQQSAIAELSRVALTSAQDAIPRACNIVRESLEADLSLFLELDEKARVLRSTAGAPNVPALTIPLEGSQSGLSIERNAPVVIEDYTARPIGPWLGLGMTSGMTIPVVSNAHRFGVLTAHNRGRRRFDDAQVDLMKSLANILADALEREHGLRALASSEARLEQADRLSSLGRLAATVAHEFNNVLMGISPFIEVMRRGRNVETSLDHIARAVKRGKRITEDILRFTQPAEPVRSAIDTASWVQTMMSEARTLLPRTCELEWVVEPRDLLIYGDANQLHQTFVNLILNARDAMPTGGLLSIHVRREQRFAHFVVRDTGTGMSADTLHHIFEPFFTTKKNGTGLGLPVAHQVVERHGGRMLAESVPGAGTTFHLYLPLAEEDALIFTETHAAAAPLDVPPRILLVEDDESVALGLMEILKMENLRVELATSGRAAIEAIDASPPDLVLLDVGLPDMEGTAVYAEIAARHPDVAVIFSTGHGDRSKLESVLERPNVGYLLKPYESSTLIKTIREVL
jgi:PAS domain S-box-containing protein